MRYRKTIILANFFLIILLLAGCEKEQNLQIPKRTYMIYMNGADLESRHQKASEDILEILGAKKGEKTTVLMETGGCSEWHMKEINPTRNERFVLGDRLQKIQSLPQKNMGESATLTDFILWAEDYAPADEYYLILWNHGGNALSGFGVEERMNMDSLLLTELRTGIETAQCKSGNKLNMIAFDACLMASMENFCMLENLCEYIVASEDVMPAFGFSYREFFEKQKKCFFSRDVAITLSETFFSGALRKGVKERISITAVDTKKIPLLRQNLKQALVSLKQEMPPASKENERLYKVLSFGGEGRMEGYSNMLDVYSLLSAFLNPQSKELKQLRQTLEETVIYKRNGLINRDCSGVSIYFPKYIYGGCEDDVRRYESVAFDNEYKNFIQDYTAERMRRGASIHEDRSENRLLLRESLLYKIYLSHDDKYSYRIMENKLFGTKKIISKNEIVLQNGYRSEQKYFYPSQNP